jgi:hypothetical protein
LQEDPLIEQLRSSAARFAQSGLRARLDGDWAVHQLHIATAFELLAKAKLASIHGSLIAAPKDFDSLLRLSGHARHARRSPDGVRTITISEALTPVGQVIPAIENLSGDLKYLAEVRNGVVHAGHLSPDAQDRVLVPFINACDLLLKEMEGSGRDEFWGDFLGMVDTHVTESVEAAELAASEAVTAARLAFEQRFSDMDPATRRAVLTGIEQSYELVKYEQELTECPACQTQALVYGSHDIDWEPEWEMGDDGEPWSPGAYPTVTFRPGTLECKACGLVLDGEDELRAGGVDESWQIEDADPRDFYPDPDWESTNRKGGGPGPLDGRLARSAGCDRKRSAVLVHGAGLGCDRRDGSLDKQR